MATRTIDDMVAILAYCFRGEDFKTFFPIGSYVKTTVCPLKATILDGGLPLKPVSQFKANMA
jgi:hypothetical protein